MGALTERKVRLALHCWMGLSIQQMLRAMRVQMNTMKYDEVRGACEVNAPVKSVTLVTLTL